MLLHFYQGIHKKEPTSNGSQWLGMKANGNLQTLNDLQWQLATSSPRKGSQGDMPSITKQR